MLKCQICGFKGKSLVSHIIRKHDVIISAYKSKYNVDKVQIISEHQKQQLSALWKVRWKTDEWQKKFKKNHKSPLQVKYWVEMGLSENEAIKKIKKIQSDNAKCRVFSDDSTAFQYKWWMKKYNYSKEDAINKVKEIQIENSNKSSRYSGKVSTPERNKKISVSMSKHIQNVGPIKWASHFGDFIGGCRSIGEVELYNYIKSNLNIDAECNMIIDKYNVDILYENKIIEYFGDYWHANPKKYSSDWKHKHLNKRADEIWISDKNRIKNLEDRGYDVLVIWETDWHNDKINSIKRINKFLNENVKAQNK